MIETAIQKKLPETIVYGKGAIAWKTDEARLRIWSSPQRYEWVQYLDAVRNCYQSLGNWRQVPYRYYLQVTSYFAERWMRENTPEMHRQRFDWLVYGGCARATERKMMVELTNALLRSGATVGYLVRFGTEEHREIARMGDEYRRQLTLIDLYTGVHGQERRLSAIAVPLAWRHFQQINDLLQSDLRISPSTFSFFLNGAVHRLLWERIRSWVEYDNLIVRNHFGSLESVIALDGLLRGKHVVTLQHGVISSMGFFPILADTVVTFGRASAEFMQRIDTRFGQCTGTTPFARRFIAAGSLFDEIEELCNTFHNRTLLVVDQDSRGARRFYGLADALDALHKTVVQCAREIAGLTVIYRLHPSARSVPLWVQAVQQECGNVHVSQGVPLLQDLKRSTVVVGLFSGVLTVAAACGVPTIFLWKDGWFYTPDLQCFATYFTSPDAAVSKIRSLCSSEEEYARSSQEISCSAEAYYTGRAKCDFQMQYPRMLL